MCDYQCQQIFHMMCAVPEFSITPLAQTVLESAGNVEICIITNSSLAREIEVTAKPDLIGGLHNPTEGKAKCIGIKF